MYRVFASVAKRQGQECFNPNTKLSEDNSDDDNDDDSEFEVEAI